MTWFVEAPNAFVTRHNLDVIRTRQREGLVSGERRGDIGFGSTTDEGCRDKPPEAANAVVNRIDQVAGLRRTASRTIELYVDDGRIHRRGRGHGHYRQRVGSQISARNNNLRSICPYARLCAAVNWNAGRGAGSRIDDIGRCRRFIRAA